MKAYILKSAGGTDKYIDFDNPVINDIILASSFFNKLTGLMFKESLDKNEGMLFMDCNSIHTFWMRFSVDVVFMDYKNRVLRIYHSLRPFRATPIIKDSKKVLEIKSGMALKIGIEINDLLHFID